MGGYLNDTLLAALAADPRVGAVVAEGDDLVLRMDGEILRLTQDTQNGRTVCWADIRILQPSEIAGGAAAARRYNATVQLESGLTMGFFLKGNALVLGKSLDVPEMAPGEAAGVAHRVCDGLRPARALLDAVLEDARCDDRRTLQQGDEALIRV
ncbi:hypothetical protein [Breoghania sp. JC706]|uniref:hypothetical protein n=1 Tax=Breoghania sp. JC706 TaxID=3117732 RepID=UPI00300BC6C7